MLDGRTTRRFVTLALITACLGLAGCAGSAPVASTLKAEAPRDSSPVATATAATSCEGKTMADGIHTIRSGGIERTYFLHVPEGGDPNTALPLILAFHGRGGTGEAMATYSDLSALPAIVAYPNGESVAGHTAWQGAPYSPKVDDVAFVSDLISHLQRQLCVDPSRIFAVGKSNGGGFTALLACRLHTRIAAFAMVSGAFYRQTSSGCAASPVPILEFHGTADPVIHYDGGVSHGEPYPSITSWLTDRAAIDGCTAGPTRKAIGADVTRLDWTGCSSGSALIHYRISGGGHTWPGASSKSGYGHMTRTISATSIAWRFFLAHPLR